LRKYRTATVHWVNIRSVNRAPFARYAFIFIFLRIDTCQRQHIDGAISIFRFPPLLLQGDIAKRDISLDFDLAFFGGITFDFNHQDAARPF
jgi:hypothetical protein